MVTASGFDASATTYDTSFTNTEIGRLQRRRVYKYLNRYLNTSEPLNILELNCGTGEDALVYGTQRPQSTCHRCFFRNA